MATSLVAKGLAAAAGAGALAFGLSQRNSRVASASDDACHPPELPWNHRKFYQQFDARSIRRGYHVYRNVCATCHSMNRLAYRNLVGVGYTEAEMKEIASETDIVDGPDDTGEMFERPGKLADYFPSPYPNEQAARAANAGALPPDLTVMAKARHGAEDYLFHLLMGYHEDPPAGVELPEGQYYNAYFPGGKIGMAPPIFDGVVDFEDGVEASASQVSKDVSTFLAWSGNPEQDLRYRMGTKVMFTLGMWMSVLVWYKRFKWSWVKNRQFVSKFGEHVH